MYKNPENTSKKNLDLNSKLKIFQIYKSLKYPSLKLDSYFQVYEEIFKKYVGKKITFVEVGVLGGGSLFMWKDYFGKDARIIGIDINPEAEKWKDHGFEIFIGSQSKEKFWKDFYNKVGKIDILLDDGGHHNKEQIISVHSSIPNINDKGVIVVEDTHSSYMKEFNKHPVHPMNIQIIYDLSFKCSMEETQLMQMQMQEQMKLEDSI